jgi:F-type H+-transporting ATPase subunit alpha
MKQVAGRLKLELAQYRELAAFAQFGSDLDKSTQAQLERGVRLVEILKQPQFEPRSLSQQVAILFAGTRGFLDKYPVDKLKEYEPQLLSFIASKYPEVNREVEEKREIGADLEKKMKDVLTEFETVFVTA